MLKHQNIHSKNNFHKVSFYFLVEVLKIIEGICPFDEYQQAGSDMCKAPC